MWGINLISRKSGGTTKFYVQDAHGDVVCVTENTGVPIRYYAYDAFGNEKDPDSTDSNPFRYCGEYFDKETGTYYLRARYYDPAIGRFTQQDTHWSPANAIYGDNPRKINERQDALGLTTYAYAPEISAIMQGGNLYVYCVNNPVMYVDRTGNLLSFALAGGGTIATGAANFWNPVGWYILGGLAIFAIGGILIEFASSNGTPVVSPESSGAISTPGSPPPPNDDDDDYKKLSNKKKDHILNNHAPRNVAQQLKHNPHPETLLDKSFFNISWSEAQIVEAVTQGYNYGLSIGITTGNILYHYAGEYIVLCFENGVLHTAYGLHRYGIAELLALLG